MNRKAATIVSAAAAIAGGTAAVGATPAQAPAVPVAASYAELLEPIPNAVERLKLADAQAASRPAELIPAQYYQDYHHHHHHHHHHGEHDSRWFSHAGRDYKVAIRRTA